MIKINKKKLFILIFLFLCLVLLVGGFIKAARSVYADVSECDSCMNRDCCGVSCGNNYSCIGDMSTGCSCEINTPIPKPTNTPIPKPTNTPIPKPTNTPIPKPTNTPIPPPNPICTPQATQCVSTTECSTGCKACSGDGTYWNCTDDGNACNWCRQQNPIPPPAPNCYDLKINGQRGPVTVSKGDKIKLSAYFTSTANGNLTEIGLAIASTNCIHWKYDYRKKINTNTNDRYESDYWVPNETGEYYVFCRAWNDSIAECRGRCVDRIPRYQCAGNDGQGSTTYTTLNVVESASCPTKPKGDANCNGKIDGVDYSIWLNRQCTSGCSATNLVADFNDDRRVNDQDYTIWFNNRN